MEIGYKTVLIYQQLAPFIPLIKIRLLNSFENYFAIVNIIREIILKQESEFQTIHRTSFHSLQIEIFINICPIDNVSKIFSEHHIQPNSHTSAISFCKWMCDIHFNILFNNCFKRIFIHLFDFHKNF